MSKRRVLATLVLVLGFQAHGDELADDVVSGWEFKGVFDIEASIISEDFLVQNQWQEPDFIQPAGERDIASLEGLDLEGDNRSSLPLGRLEVIEEIPYSYPSLKRWMVRNRILKYRRHRKKK